MVVRSLGRCETRSRDHRCGSALHKVLAEEDVGRPSCFASGFKRRVEGDECCGKIVELGGEKFKKVEV